MAPGRIGPSRPLPSRQKSLERFKPCIIDHIIDPLYPVYGCIPVGSATFEPQLAACFQVRHPCVRSTPSLTCYVNARADPAARRTHSAALSLSAARAIATFFGAGDSRLREDVGGSAPPEVPPSGGPAADGARGDARVRHEIRRLRDALSPPGRRAHSWTAPARLSAIHCHPPQSVRTGQRTGALRHRS